MAKFLLGKLTVSHLRNSVDVILDKSQVKKNSFRDLALKRRTNREVKAKLEEWYKTGRNRWFFQKL
uniref:Uncharacterized protein n=1 Tax=Octopus bimaculoides TaxID=37653 RepID=A0A0L8G2C1_OCTBM